MDFDYLLNPETYVDDDAVNRFHIILEANTNFKPQCSLLIQKPELIQSMPEYEKHVQIIFNDRGIDGDFKKVGHWAAIYYNGQGTVYIYDSLYKELTKKQRLFLRRMFRFEFTIDFVSNIQQQRNVYDCGIFAINFATSLALGIKPEEHYICIDTMRTHLVTILNTNTLILFPSILLDHHQPSTPAIADVTTASSLLTTTKLSNASTVIKKMQYQH